MDLRREVASMSAALDINNRPWILYKDVVEKRRPNGSVYTARVTPWKRNSIVVAMNDMARAFAALLATDPLIQRQDGLAGIQYHAFGEGDSGDPSFEDTAPDLNERTLFDERYRRTPSAVEYIETLAGTADAASGLGFLVDPTVLTAPDGFHVDNWVHFTAGTGMGEFRQIVGSTESTNRIDFSPADIDPDGTSQYEIISVQDPAHPIVPNADRSILQVRTVLNFQEPEETGGQLTIREQGLFGLNATEELDTGFCLMVIRHADLPKDSDTRITRFLRIAFF